MADRKELEAALVQADKDGDQQAVQTLMAEINKLDNYKPPSTLAQFGRELMNSAARPLLNAMNAIPGMAEDTGVELRNLSQKTLHAVAPGVEQKIYDTNKKIIGATGNNAIVDAILPTAPEQYEDPTQMYQRDIDKVFTPPATTSGKVAEFANTLLAGGMMPNPTTVAGVPKAFQTAAQAEKAHKLAILRAAQDQGAVVPPATVNPTYTNRMLESLAGKYATAQEASVKNAQNFTNPLARQALNLPDNAITDKATLDQVIKVAGDSYDTVRKAGVFTAPKSYMQTLDGVVADATKAAKSFPEIGNTLGGKEITQVVEMAKGNAAGIPGARPKLDADATVSAIKVLRQKAADAFASGQPSVGGAYKKIATAMEDAIEEGLKAKGKDGAGMLKDFRAGRQQIAKAFAVLEASNPVTGDTSAKMLGQQLQGGAKLSGELLDAARFGTAYPKEGRLLNESVGVNQLTGNLGLLAAGNGGEGNGKLLYAGLPLLGAGIRSALLSPRGQRMLIGQGNGLVGRSLNNPLVIPASYYGAQRILGTLPKKDEDQ